MTADELALFDALMRKHAVPADDLAGAAICRALSKALAATEIDPSTVNGLSALLPRPAVSGQTLDVKELTDAELDQVEAIIRAHGVVPRTDDDGKTINELLTLTEALNAQLRDQGQMIASWELSHAAAIASAQSRAAEAEAKLDEVRRELAEVAARVGGLVPDAVPVAEVTPAMPDNVVELRPPPSRFAGLGASIGTATPPHVASGPEYLT